MRSRLSRQHTLLPHASDMVQIWESTRARLETWLHSRKTQATALDHSLTPSVAEKDFHTLSFFVILEGLDASGCRQFKNHGSPSFSRNCQAVSWWQLHPVLARAGYKKNGSLKGSHSYLARLLCRMQLMPGSLPTG